MNADATPGNDAPLDIDRLMREIRADVAARLPDAADVAFDARGGRDAGVFGATAGTGRAVRLSRVGAFSAPLPRKDAYCVADFLAYHDEDFIGNAYRALLGREPDAEGATRYLAKLRSGTLSRIEVLGRIRHSPEGKAAGVAVDGLLIPFATRTARRVPVIGRLAGIAQYLWRLPDLARNHEVLENAVFESRNDLRRRIDAIVTEIEQALAASRAVQASDANRLESRIREVQTQALDIKAAAHARSEKLASAQDDARTHVEREFGAMQGQFAAEVLKVTRGLDALRDGHQDIGQRLAQLAAVSDFASRVASVDRAMADVNRLASGATVGDDAAPAAMPEGFYVAFEDRFRGTRADVKARTEVYLPVVREAGAGSAEAPILDIGCGRGEWLEVLQEQGLRARGVDVNDVVVAGCRARGLDVTAGDAIEHLRRLSPNSLGAVSAMHVIEHLPFARVLDLFDETHRVLRPGGIAIFETPNPENLVVGACSFYYDPTHQRPLPPEPFRFILETRGFARVDILRLHPDAPVPDLATLPDALADVIKQRLFGPRDYALIGVKKDAH